MSIDIDLQRTYILDDRKAATIPAGRVMGSNGMVFSDGNVTGDSHLDMPQTVFSPRFVEF